MAFTRADTLTGTKKQKEFFSDFLNDMDKTPYGDQIGRVINENSVNQSLRNLIKTSLGERLFQPNIGSDIYNLLFEHNLTENLDLVDQFIRNTVKYNEPRAQIIEVSVESDGLDENSINIVIKYNLVNNPEPITLNVLLKRVR